MSNGVQTGPPIGGQKGLVAMFKMMHRLDKAKAELDSVKAEKVEMERKVDGGRAMLHSVRPVSYELKVAVGELPKCEFASHAAMVQQGVNEIRRDALRIVQAIALQVERSRQPVCRVEQSVAAMILWCAIDRRQVAAKLELIAEYSGVFGNVRVEVARPLGKAAGSRPVECVGLWWPTRLKSMDA